MEWKKSVIGGLVTTGMMVFCSATAGAQPSQEEQGSSHVSYGAQSNASSQAALPGITCSTRTLAAGGQPNGLISADTPSPDGTRMFNQGSAFNISLVTDAAAADTVIWWVTDYLGNFRGGDMFDVPAGVQTSTLSCTSSASGYFAVKASLKREGGSLPNAGTRPSGISTFGILPDVTGALPVTVFSHPDQHRFGMQGFNFNGSMLAALGVKQTTTGRQLSEMEKDAPNTWKPSLDSLPSLYKSGKQMRLVRLDGIPAWASPTGQITSGYAPMPSQMGYFKSYMARVGAETEAIRKAYYPTLQRNYYQVTWEPLTAWKDTTANFVAMYKAVYEGLHASDPNAIVMGTTDFPAHCPACVSRTFKDFGITPYIDGVTTHAYWGGYNNPRHPPEQYDTDPDPKKAGQALDHQMQTLREQMQLAKPNMRLWSTELGVSYDEGSDYGSNFPTTNQLYAQAAVGARAHLIVLGEGAQVTYFFFGPDYPKEVGFGTFFDNDHPRGALDATNMSPKPEALAFAAMTRIIDGTETLGRLNDLPSMVHGYAFQRLGNSAIITALWTHNNAQWPTADGAYSSTYSTTYALAVDKSGTSGSVTVFDLMGNPTKVPYTNGIATLTLTESPIYVVSSNAPVIQARVTKPVGYMGQ